MLLAQISDMHYKQRGVLVFGKVDAHAFLVRCLDQIRALEPAPDALLITGDLTNDGDLSAYRELATMLDELRFPLYPIPGNHDNRKGMREIFPALEALAAEDTLCYAVDDFPVRIVALDSLVDGEPYGQLGEAQLDWLRATLSAAPDKPTVVMLHHPPFKTGIGHMDWSMLRDAEALAAAIRDHPQVERVLVGHVHRPIQTRFAGTIAQTCPGVAHQVKLTLGEGRGPWIMEPPGFLLHRWTAEGDLVTHQVPIGEFGPEGQFRDPHSGKPVAQ
jgi:3',5'-cyclic AMP phosphodiesterase CpdA